MEQGAAALSTILNSQIPGDPFIPSQSSAVTVEKNRGGRPKGSISRRTKMLRMIRDNALKKGRTPLDVMLKNMYFFDDKAEALLNVVEQKLGEKRVVPLEILELLREMNGFRMNAQKCACDAAPFVHPKLAAITYENKNKPLARKPEEEMSDEECRDYFNRLRQRPAYVEPMVVTLDNDTGAPIHSEESEEA